MSAHHHPPCLVTQAASALVGVADAGQPVNGASIHSGGVYDALGRPLSEGLPPCGSETEITRTRPIVRALTEQDTLETTDIERIWLLPLGADPGPIPPAVLGELVATLERG